MIQPPKRTIIPNVKWMACAVLLGIWFALPVPANALTVEEYSYLSRDLLELSTAEWMERVAALKQYGDNPSALSARLDWLSRYFKRVRQQLCSKYGTTVYTHRRFMTRNRDRVKSYLIANEDLDREIKALTDQLKGLTDQFESLVKNADKGAQQ